MIVMKEEILPKKWLYIQMVVLLLIFLQLMIWHDIQTELHAITVQFSNLNQDIKK